MQASFKFLYIAGRAAWSLIGGRRHARRFGPDMPPFSRFRYFAGFPNLLLVYDWWRHVQACSSSRGVGICLAIEVPLHFCTLQEAKILYHLLEAQEATLESLTKARKDPLYSGTLLDVQPCTWVVVVRSRPSLRCFLGSGLGPCVGASSSFLGISRCTELSLTCTFRTHAPAFCPLTAASSRL